MTPGNIEYLVLCALEAELDQLKRQFGPAGPTTEYTCQVKRGDGHTITIAVASVLGMTQAPAAARAVMLVTRYEPKAVIVVGICGGIDESNVWLGDVVVPELVINAGHLKDEAGTDGARRTHRGFPYRAHAPLLQTARSLHALMPALEGLPTRPGPGHPTLHCIPAGVLACSDEVIRRRDNPNRSWFVKEHREKALAVNMESAGIAEACQQVGIPFLVIRGVQDDAAETTNNEVKEAWRTYSAAVAAAFARKVCEQHHSERGRRVEPAVISHPQARPPTPLTHFAPVIQGPDESQAREDGLTPTDASPIKLLHGPGGAGKTYLAWRAADSAAANGSVVLVPYWEEVRTSDRVLDQALRPMGWSVERLRLVASVQPVTLLLDGLNQLEGLTARSDSGLGLLGAVRDEVQAIRGVCPSLRVLATDRNPRAFLAGQESYSLRPLAADTVAGALDQARGGGAFQRLAPQEREQLGRPFHLQLAISDAGKGVGQERMTRLLEAAGLTPVQLADIGKALLAHPGGLLEVPPLPHDGGRILSVTPAVDSSTNRFSHHMWRDLLCGYALASEASLWSPDNFDSATTNASGAESLALAYDLLPSPQARRTFLSAVYDWNYRMPSILLKARAPRAPRDEDDEIRWVVLASLADKLHDPLASTRRQATAILDNHPDPIAHAVRSQPTSQGMRGIVRTLAPGSPWFEAWRAVFCRDGGVWRLADNALLLAPDPLVGWAAANLARRCTVDDDLLQEISTALTDEARPAVTRWRIAHALGAHARDAHLQALRVAASQPGKGEGFQWVVYGATRALLERRLTAQNSSVRDQALEQLLLAVHLITPAPGAREAFGAQVRNQLDDLWKPVEGRGMVRTLFIRTIEMQPSAASRLAMQARLRELEAPAGPSV